LLAFLGALIYGFPSRELIVIAVTGTNGKSTVVYLTTEVLEKAGFKTASLSSIKFKIGKKEWPNLLKMTMPGRFKLQKFLRQAVKNLTKEHIETHKGFENYKKAKGKLFTALRKSKKKNKFIVTNLDDKYASYFARLAGKVKKHTYGIHNKKAEIRPDKIDLKIFLPGEFNVYNSLAAVCVGKP